MTKFCHNCKKATPHRKLAKTGFFSKCFATAICFAVIGEGLGLREPDWECLGCGITSSEE